MLPTAAEWLLTHARQAGLATPSPIANELDLSNTLVLVPGSRSARTLASLLLTLGNQRGMLLSLPTFVTPGSIIDRLFGVEARDAEPAAVHMALVQALAVAKPQIIEDLVRRPLHAASFAVTLNYAELFARTLQTLAGDDLLPNEVPLRVEGVPASSRTDAVLATFRPEQWHALQQIFEATRDKLLSASLTYAPWRKVDLVRNHTPGLLRHVVLVCASELPALVQRAVSHHAASVTALIAAPPALAPRFTALGVLDSPAEPATPSWSGTLPVTDDELTMVATPQEQAESALTRIAMMAGTESQDGNAPTPSDILIVVPDREVTAALETLAPEVASSPALRVRAADPIPLSHLAPAMVLRAALHFSHERTVSSLCTLVAQPDIAAAVSRHMPPKMRSHWPLVLDRYASGVPDRTIGSSQAGTRADTETWPGARKRDGSVLSALLASVDRLLAPLLHLQPGESREPSGTPASLLATAAQSALALIYAGRTASRTGLADRQLIACLRKLGDTLSDFRELSPTLQPRSVVDALTLLSRQLDATTVAPEPDPNAIELLGWLEAVVDPAPILILTGVNDHCLPTPSPSDGILPDPLRALLRLPTAKQREYRDSYLLELARRTHRTHLICGKRSQDGDPLRPSRLVLQDPETLASRILRMQEPQPMNEAMARRTQVAAQDSFEVRPILNHVELPLSMSVTSFAAYLRSPYGYYLRHILQVRDIEAPAPELSPLHFGNLMHESLRFWALSPESDSSDSTDIRGALLEGLHRAAQSMLGHGHRIEVEMQLRIAQERLSVFSQWQALRRSQGWRLLESEWQPAAHSVALDIPGQQPMPLTGRIDRIEVNESSTPPRYAIIDYKTGDSPKKPDNPHRTEVRKGREIVPFCDLLPDGTLAAAPDWEDLQLPLYRHLVQNLIPADAHVELALLNLPRDHAKAGLETLDATPEVFASADAAARWVVRSIRALHFEDAGSMPPSDATSALLAGVGLFSPRAAARVTREPTSGGDS